MPTASGFVSCATAATAVVSASLLAANRFKGIPALTPQQRLIALVVAAASAVLFLIVQIARWVSGRNSSTNVAGGVGGAQQRELAGRSVGSGARAPAGRRPADEARAPATSTLPPAPSRSALRAGGGSSLQQKAVTFAVDLQRDGANGSASKADADSATVAVPIAVDSYASTEVWVVPSSVASSFELTAAAAASAAVSAVAAPAPAPAAAPVASASAAVVAPGSEFWTNRGAVAFFGNLSDTLSGTTPIDLSLATLKKMKDLSTSLLPKMEVPEFDFNSLSGGGWIPFEALSQEALHKIDPALLPYSVKQKFHEKRSTWQTTASAASAAPASAATPMAAAPAPVAASVSKSAAAPATAAATLAALEARRYSPTASLASANAPATAPAATPIAAAVPTPAPAPGAAAAPAALEPQMGKMDPDLAALPGAVPTSFDLTHGLDSDAAPAAVPGGR